jgi:hypothetical protein
VKQAPLHRALSELLRRYRRGAVEIKSNYVLAGSFKAQKALQDYFRHGSCRSKNKIVDSMKKARYRQI